MKTKLLLLVFLIPFVTSLEEEEDPCPCLPAKECPQPYGQSEWDVLELGTFSGCSSGGRDEDGEQGEMVRCCGVVVSLIFYVLRNFVFSLVVHT